jgi:hypothetical protein
MTGRHTLLGPVAGDRIIFERIDGHYDVREVSASGAHDTSRESMTFEEARQFARGQLETGHDLWICHHSNVKSFELFTARARSLALNGADALMSTVRHRPGHRVRAQPPRTR